ncbi:CinA family protein [Persicirhabdus sediminis]|uniref:Nicotinamide-nucleotide amidohydrolase family protein n=1 Tax=Persicirhabdus sediminis TaxID=454144 RepID=A0A8J7MBR7_9BACT|nr:nicotinamide-nucleotide amidohydrolase family protein [Persicirhabdus sediminis]MBK1790133.1 nicotinamide-nucleotide amidohydrolase family protein [Persicirhabdus sediminis]
MSNSEASLGSDELEVQLVNKLASLGLSVATVESCTGGLIAARITDVSGASAVFTHGWVTYSNEAKSQLVGVPADLLETHGAVSEPVAKAMAEGGLKNAAADFAIAVTGIAGPTGGTADKPVGTVWVALAIAGQPTQTQLACFPQGRAEFKKQVCELVFAKLIGQLS